MAQLNYVPDTTDKYQGFEPLPAGEYKVQIVDSDIVTPKSGNGSMIKFQYEVIADPQFDGRKIFDNIIIEHSSVDAERIGKQKLNTICALTGVKQIKDTAQLHGKTMSVLLSVKDNQGEKQNVIKKYLPFNSDRDEEHEEQKASGNKKHSFVK